MTFKGIKDSLYYNKVLALLEEHTTGCAVRHRNPKPIEPVLLNGFGRIGSEQKERLVEDFFSGGVAYYQSIEVNEDHRDIHPVHMLARELQGDLPLQFPVAHPMENHCEARKRFGPPDGTLKIYHLDVEKDESQYIEQAETSGDFLSHNDGLGYGGKVRAFILHCDSAPIYGGFTYFSDGFLAAKELLERDEEAFCSLLSPYALRVLRPRGKGAIAVNSPIIYIDDAGCLKIFFRVSTGEYRVRAGFKSDALNRAIQFFYEKCEPFSEGSSFVCFSSPNQGVIVDNSRMLHGRTSFSNGASGQRVLARKWFMEEQKYEKYIHVPKMFVSSDLLDLYPEYIRNGELEGEWHYDQLAQINRRIG